MTDTRSPSVLAAEPRRRTLIERLARAGWIAFALMLVGALGAALIGLSSGHAYDDEGYPAGGEDASSAEGFALYLLLTRVLPWALVTTACGFFLKGRFQSTGLLILSIPAWSWNALVAYRLVTWPESRQWWPYCLLYVAPAFVVSAGAWLSWPKAQSAQR